MVTRHPCAAPGGQGLAGATEARVHKAHARTAFAWVTAPPSLLTHRHHQPLITSHSVTKETQSAALVNYNVVGWRASVVVLAPAGRRQGHTHTQHTTSSSCIDSSRVYRSGWQCCPLDTLKINLKIIQIFTFKSRKKKKNIPIPRDFIFMRENVWKSIDNPNFC